MKRIIILTVFTISLFIHYQSFSQCTYTSCNNSYAINGASTLGSNNDILGAGSIGLGSDIHISNISTNTIAIGGMLETTGPYSFVIGTGGQAINGRRLVNGHQETLMIGFNSTKPTFFPR